MSPSNIYVFGIYYASNNICSFYTCTEFEGKKGVNNIACFLLRWINDKGYYSRSYVNNHKMPEIDILDDNCGGQNKNNLLIRFFNIIKNGGLFGADTLNFYIKGHTNNYYDRAFNGLKVLYQKKNVFTLEKFCEIFNINNNVEVIQVFHEKSFDL